MQTKRVVMYNVPRRSDLEVVGYLKKKDYLDILKTKPMRLFSFYR